MIVPEGPSESRREDEEGWMNSLDRALEEALAPWRRSADRLTILFSGGVDSSLLAWELRARPATTLFTIGLRNAADLARADRAARTIALPWEGLEVAPEELRQTLREESVVPGHLSLGRRSLRLAIAIAIERAPDPTLLCGQGADELFLGYAHFRGLDPGAAEQRAAEDLQRLVNEDWPATQALAVRLGRRIEAPFLHPSFLDAANAIPLERRMPTESTKAFWRRWVVRRGLPEELAARPKKAIQYGSGVDRWLRTMVSGRRPGSPPSR